MSDLDPKTIADRPSSRDSQPAARAPSRAVGAGQSIGRYMVLKTLGEGGMGVVYAAYDPELDRKVALKLLRAETQRDSARARLLREAQAMARLSHPNVVTVFDVGWHGDQLFVAMEMVEGTTLRRWVSEQNHTVAQVVEVFRQAGRGLAAAHAAGLVHRDFKPDNVLIGASGRVAVTDFGLARLASAEEERPPAEDVEARRSSLEMRLTQAGVVMGTPIYMAPEQHRGLPTDARSDQFAFCASLFEVLYGVPPFPGKTGQEIGMAAIRGEVTVPKGRRVPGWLHRALLKGLATRREWRFETMEHLLAALQPPLKRRRAALVVAALAAVVGAGSLVVADLTSRRARLCAGADEQLARAWGGVSQKDAHAAVLATGVARAGEVWGRVESALDVYAQSWREAKGRTCAAAARRGLLPDDQLRRELSCLGDRAAELEALSFWLRAVDAASLNGAVVAAGQLSPVASCAETAEPWSAAAEPLRRRLAEPRVYVALFKNAEAAKGAHAVAEQAEQLGLDAVVAEALVVEGRAQQQQGSYDEAERVLVSALVAAERVAAVRTAAQAWTERCLLYGLWWRRYEGALEHASHAGALLESLSSGTAAPSAEDELVRAQMLACRGLVLLRTGDFQGALDDQQAALAIQERLLGPLHPTLTRAIIATADAQDALGQRETAEANYRRAVDLLEKSYPKDHPNIGIALLNEGVLLVDHRQAARAEKPLARARAIFEASAGLAHINTLKTMIQQGRAQAAMGRPELAVEVLSAARERMKFPPDDLLVLQAEQELGDACAAAGDFSSALTHHRAVLVGQLPAAVRAKVEASVASDLLELRQPKPALEAAERAVDRLGDTEGSVAGAAYFARARARWANKRRAEALADASRARAFFEKAGATVDLAEVRSWLQKAR